MTDSDNESFHSAVDSFPDLEDADLERSSLEKGRNDTDQKAKHCTEGNRSEFDASDTIGDKHSSDSKKPFGEVIQKAYSSEKLKYGKTSGGKTRDSPERATESKSEAKQVKSEQEAKAGGVSTKERDLGTLEGPNSFHGHVEYKKPVPEPENDSEFGASFRKNEELRRMDKSNGQRTKKREGKIAESAVFGQKAGSCTSSLGQEGPNVKITGNDDKAAVEEKLEEPKKEGSAAGPDGWDDWEFEYPEKDDDVGRALQQKTVNEAETLQRRASEERRRRDDSRKPKTAQETEQVKESKSFWDWTEFGGVVAAVGEGITSISSVVELGLGLPTPEELARYQPDERPTEEPEVAKRSEDTGAGLTSYGKLFAGFGANVVTGSLDVLEALGKKTFEKLTVPEEGSEKRRFIFEPERGKNLSEVLRELRESQAEETVPETSCITKRELTFIDFFEKFSGMLHLEGLEMVSKNHWRKIPAQRRKEVDEIFADDLRNVLEDYQEDEQENFVEHFKEILLATGLPYNGSGLIDCHKRCEQRLQKLPDSGDQIFEFFLECLADFTAQSVQSVHKMGQLLLITATAVRQEPFCDFHALIGRQISYYSNQFAQHISAVDNPSEETDELVTTVFLAAGDAFSYVQQSFRLLRPLLIL